MDKFEKALCNYDKANVNDKRMDARVKESAKQMKDDGKYYKMWKDKVIDLRF